MDRPSDTDYNGIGYSGAITGMWRDGSDLGGSELRGSELRGRGDMVRDKKIVLKYYHVRSTLIVIYVWLTLIGVSTSSYNIIEGEFLHCGPGGNAYFITIPIDSWNKWTCVMTYSFFSQVIYSFVGITLSPFISNVVRDYKSPVSFSTKYVIFVMFSYKLYQWFHEILEVFLTLTLQLQYYIPAIIADIVISICSTWDYNRKSIAG